MIESVAKCLVVSSWFAANVYMRKDWFSFQIYDPKDLEPCWAQQPPLEEKQRKKSTTYKFVPATNTGLLQTETTVH